MFEECERYPHCYLSSRLKEVPVTSDVGSIELVAFDMDGVLVDIHSSWQHIHDYFGTCNHESVLAYIMGDIDYLEFIRRDASLWVENGKPVNIERLQEILSDVPLMNGAKDCVDSLKDMGLKTCIVSAGFDVLAKRIGDELGIDHVFANGIGLDEKGFFNGKGRLGVKLLYKDEKILEISKDFGISLENIASVGNSCFDIPMLRISGLGIAFNPEDDCVKKAADVVIEGKDLRKICLYLESYV